MPLAENWVDDRRDAASPTNVNYSEELLHGVLKSNSLLCRGAQLRKIAFPGSKLTWLKC